MRTDSLGREPHEPGAERHPDVVTQRALAVGDGLVDHGRHAGVALDPGRRLVVHRVAGAGPLHVGHEIGQHDLFDAGLAERRQDALDVAQEDPVGSDHEHALVLEREPVGVEQVRGAVQRDHRLAGARPTLDDEHARPAASG